MVTVDPINKAQNHTSSRNFLVGSIHRGVHDFVSAENLCSVLKARAQKCWLENSSKSYISMYAQIGEKVRSGL